MVEFPAGPRDVGSFGEGIRNALTEPSEYPAATILPQGDANTHVT